MNFFKIYFAESKSKVFFMIILALISSSALLMTTILAKIFIENIEYLNVSYITLWSMTLIIVTFIYFISGFYLKSIGENRGWSVSNLLRYKLASELIRDDNLTENKKIYEIIENDCFRLQKFYSEFFPTLISSVILLVISGATLMFINFKIGLGVFSYFILSTLIVVYLRTKILPLGYEFREKQTDLFTHLVKIYDNFWQIDGLKIAKQQSESLEKKFDYILRPRIKAQVFTVSLWMYIMFSFNLSYIIALIPGGYLAVNDKITFGSLFLLYSTIELINRPIDDIRQQLKNFQDAQLSIQRIKNEFSMKNTNHTNQDKVDIDEVIVNNISVCNEGNLLNYNDLTFNNNSTYLIKGKSGVGKSSLLKIISGAWGYQGQIIINKYFIASNEFLKSNSIYFDQNSKLFDGTIMQNLFIITKSNSYHHIPRRDATIKLILKNLNLNLNEYFEVDKLNSIQRKLIILLRIYIYSCEKKIILIDEFEAGLPNEYLYIVTQVLNEIRENKILIFVSHTNQLENWVDHIYKIQRDE